MSFYCVIGDPIDHSLSPAIYNALFRRYGMDDREYGRQRVDISGLPGFIASLPERDIRGFNVTMPLKNAVRSFLSWTAPDAYDGVNTVVVSRDGLRGWSTDAAGFRRSLELHGARYEGTSVAFIGCGGAARTLIRDALRRGVSSLAILNRTPSKAEAFASDPRVSVAPLSDIDRFAPGLDLLVNATPLGMRGVGRNFEDLGFVDLLPARALVADLIYDPPETDLLREARLAGRETMNGLWMLIWQAFYAFERFAGILPDADAFEAIRSEIEEGRALPLP